MRDSLNITLTDPLRRANVRPRLDALADSTGFAAAQIAGRALLLGLRAIEQDWRLLFPASDSTSPEAPSAATHGSAEPEQAPTRDAVPSDAPHRMDAQGITEPSTPAPAQAQPLDAQPEPAPSSSAEPADAPPPETQPGSAPSLPAQPGKHSSHTVAQALGHGSEAAFRQHLKRHPELRRYAQRAGRALIWDLDGLRDTYREHGYRIKGQPAHDRRPPRSPSRPLRSERPCS